MWESTVGALFNHDGNQCGCRMPRTYALPVSWPACRRAECNALYKAYDLHCGGRWRMFGYLADLRTPVVILSQESEI